MTTPRRILLSSAGILIGAMAFVIMPIAGHAQHSTGLKIEVADPNEQGDGTMSPAAAAAKARGALRLPADEKLKAAANRAHDAAAQAEAHGPAAASAADGGAAPSTLATIVGTHNFAGQSSVSSSPTDSTGAVGPTRYIQLINSIARIYNRTSHATIGSGTLNQLAGQASSVNSFDPQIIWDNQTNRFYYAMDSIVSSTNHRLTFGFSKTASPSNVTTDWCHYFISYGTPFPDYPKLGDSRFFIIIGVNVFNPGFVGSDIVAISKPPSGSTCPAASSFKTGKKANIRDSGGSTQTFTPVPSQQVDNNNTGYVVARNLSLPSNKLWFYNVTRNSSTLAPVFGNARGVTVTTYTAPPDATQPTISQKLDTLDARPFQAVQAINPDRGSVHSFYTEHTIAIGSRSTVRWYEINPAPATPVVLRSGNTGTGTAFHFNGSISPDRKRASTSTAATFGDSFIVHYNVSSTTIPARIVAGSSFNGGAFGSFVNVVNGVGPYKDFTCPNSGNTCRWGDYSAATPDPMPAGTGRGNVWNTSMYSGVASPSGASANGRTRIFSLRP